jgi:anaerobic magnesium-protoporphyrin IX monomethyl ester cyclase
MKVMLFFPPNWTPAMPHLALPSLTAYLRERGVEVIQRDLNAEVFDRILTRDYLLRSLERLRQRRPRSGTPAWELWHWALANGPALARQIEGAKRVIKSHAFYDGPRSLPAFETMIQALQLASLPYYPSTLHLQGYDSAYRADSSRAIL